MNDKFILTAYKTNFKNCSNRFSNPCEKGASMSPVSHAISLVCTLYV